MSEATIYLDENDEYRWRVRAGNNEHTFSSGEGFGTHSGAMRAKRTALKCAVEVAYKEGILREILDELEIPHYLRSY